MSANEWGLFFCVAVAWFIAVWAHCRIDALEDQVKLNHIATALEKGARDGD